MQTKVKVWVQDVPLWSQVFWCVAMILAIALYLAVLIALWKFGVVIGFFLKKLMGG